MVGHRCTTDGIAKPKAQFPNTVPWVSIPNTFLKIGLIRVHKYRVVGSGISLIDIFLFRGTILPFTSVVMKPHKFIYRYVTKYETCFSFA